MDRAVEAFHGSVHFCEFCLPRPPPSPNDSNGTQSQHRKCGCCWFRGGWRLGACSLNGDPGLQFIGKKWARYNLTGRLTGGDEGRRPGDSITGPTGEVKRGTRRPNTAHHEQTRQTKSKSFQIVFHGHCHHFKSPPTDLLVPGIHFDIQSSQGFCTVYIASLSPVRQARFETVDSL